MDLITLASNFSGTVIGKISSVILSSMYFRDKKEIEELENIKGKEFENVVRYLVDSKKMTYTELYQAKNFADIAKKADKYVSNADVLANDHNNSNNEIIDIDWLIRFYKEAGNISNKDIQDLWARILAGEISSPGSCSLKTIDTLKNLRKQDAELFIKLSEYIVYVDGHYILPNYEEYLEYNKIRIEDILLLEDFGLIKRSSFLNISFILKDNQNRCSGPLCGNQEYILYAEGDNFDIAFYPLTIVGKDIIHLIRPNTNSQALIKLCDILNKHNTNSSFHIERN